MFRIHRSQTGEVVFIISGRINAEHIAELETLIGAEDRATANFIGHTKADAERFRNQRMAKSPACESPIHGEPDH
jgi:hypothetical protein